MFVKFNKWGVILFIMTCFILSTATLAFAAQQPIQVYIDGQKINFTNQPIIENGTTLVEFRPIFEELGLQIGWEQATKMVIGSKNNLSIKLKIG